MTNKNIKLSITLTTGATLLTNMCIIIIIKNTRLGLFLQMQERFVGVSKELPEREQLEIRNAQSANSETAVVFVEIIGIIRALEDPPIQSGAGGPHYHTATQPLQTVMGIQRIILTPRQSSYFGKCIRHFQNQSWQR